MKTPPLTERKKPGLSETLGGPRHPNKCQSCAAPDARRWREHDEWDKPLPVLVMLCETCTTQLIKPHTRLYASIDTLEPWPGAMAICLDCKHRAGLECRHPDLKQNGGKGLMLSVPKPSRVHLNYGGGRGEWKNLYPGPVSKCAGREDL